MRKFSLFSRSALAALATGAAGVGGDAPGKPGEEEDPEAGPAPAPADPEDDPEENRPSAPASDATVDVVTVADATAVGADLFAAGRNAERERTAAVFGSDVGKANPSMAAWMLSSSPDATADSIIAQMGTMPQVASASGAVEIPDTNVDLGKPGAAASVQEGADDAEDVWASVQGTTAGQRSIAASDAGSLAMAAVSNGARIATGGVTATPATPAVVPTGN